MWRVEETHGQRAKRNWENSVWTSKKYQWRDRKFKKEAYRNAKKYKSWNKKN